VGGGLAPSRWRVATAADLFTLVTPPGGTPTAGCAGCLDNKSEICRPANCDQQSVCMSAPPLPRAGCVSCDHHHQFCVQVLLADPGAGFALPHQISQHQLIPWLSINSLSVSLEPSMHKQLTSSWHHRSGSEAFGDASPAAAAAPGAIGSRRGSNVSAGGEGDDVPGGGGIRRLLSRKLSRNRCARSPAQ